MIGIPIALALVCGIGTLGGILGRRRRSTEAAELETAVAAELARDPEVAPLPLKATAHVPLLTRTRATVVLSGEVPTPRAYRAVLLRLEQMSRQRPDVGVIDRIVLHAPHASRPG